MKAAMDITTYEIWKDPYTIDVRDRASITVMRQGVFVGRYPTFHDAVVAMENHAAGTTVEAPRPEPDLNGPKGSRLSWASPELNAFLTSPFSTRTEAGRYHAWSSEWRYQASKWREMQALYRSNAAVYDRMAMECELRAVNPLR